MASLYEYFVTDGAQNLTARQTWQLTDANGTKVGELIARLHLDFEANAKYVSFYIPEMPGVECPETLALDKVADILELPETSQVTMQRAGIDEESSDARELVITGQIYVYSQRPVPAELKDRMNAQAKTVGHRLSFRNGKYMDERNKLEKPRAFISYDSRDRQTIAEPIGAPDAQINVPSLV
jgi:hypothetical protein